MVYAPFSLADTLSILIISFSTAWWSIKMFGYVVFILKEKLKATYGDRRKPMCR